jgi:hypothetical protein
MCPFAEGLHRDVLTRCRWLAVLASFNYLTLDSECHDVKCDSTLKYSITFACTGIPVLYMDILKNLAAPHKATWRVDVDGCPIVAVLIAGIDTGCYYVG